MTKDLTGMLIYVVNIDPRREAEQVPYSTGEKPGSSVRSTVAESLTTSTR